MDENNTQTQGTETSEQTMGMPERQSFTPPMSGTPGTSPVRSSLMPEPKKSGSAGPIIGIIIIVILIVLAGFYFWGRSLETGVGTGNTADTSMESSDVGTPLSTSDELDTIETDLNATVLESLDAELGNIDAELNQ